MILLLNKDERAANIVWTGNKSTRIVETDFDAQELGMLVDIYIVEENKHQMGTSKKRSKEPKTPYPKVRSRST